MDYNNICPKCMREKSHPNDICIHCGFNQNEYITKTNTLPVSSVLNGRYLVGIPLGIGGFGITYIAFDMKIGGVCAIKEYMPDAVSYRIDSQPIVTVGNTKAEVFKYGLSRFVEEAEMLKQFSKSRNVINVFDSFCENNTAYYVMEYLDGHDLRHETNDFNKIMDYNYALSCFMQVMEGLEELHKRGVIHRDISPDNIYITKTGVIKILDFGSARYSTTQKDRHLSVIVKAGYAPGEQYSTRSEQGAWTDIYALCATFYHLLTGTPPPESTERALFDTLKPLNQVNRQVPIFFSDILIKGLSVRKSDRYQSIAEMKNIILANISRSSRAGRNAEIADPKAGNAIKSNLQDFPEIKNNSVSKPGPAIIQHQKYQNYLGKRVVAAAIDSLFAGILIMIVWLVLNSIFAKLDMLSEYMKPIFTLLLVLMPLLVILLNVNLEISSFQGTIGKMLVGIKVVDLDGNKIKNSNSFKRNIIKLLGILLLLTETNGRYLHEIKTNTKVVLK